METYFINQSNLKHLSKIQRVSLTLFFCLLLTNFAFAGDDPRIGPPPKMHCHPPRITSVTPTDGSAFYESSEILISLTAHSFCPPLQYQFSIDGIIKQAWSGVSSYTWVTTSQDIGIHTIKVEVKDRGGQDTKEVEVYIFRKPIPPPE